MGALKALGNLALPTQEMKSIAGPRTGLLLAAACALALAIPAAAQAAAPAPCPGAAQIIDVSGDGHHNNTDVLSAWFSESAGSVKAVVEIKQAVWEPVHDDSNEAGFVMLFSVGGQLRYVRAEAPRPPAAMRYDYGTWSAAGGFVSAGATSGQTIAGARGTVTIEVPAAAGAISGAKLAEPFVLTYDGISGGVPHWVDRAPGGVSPVDGNERGADFIVGSCSPITPGLPATTTSVALSVPARLVGGGKATVSGSITPARAGVTVELTSSSSNKIVATLKSDAAGRFSTRLSVAETTGFRAVAEQIGSQTLTLTVASMTRISVKKLKKNLYRISGTVKPALPGQLLLLKSSAYKPSATTKPSNGRFAFVLKKPSHGSYQAVFIPSGNRAERSTSNKGVVR